MMTLYNFFYTRHRVYLLVFLVFKLLLNIIFIAVTNKKKTKIRYRCEQNLINYYDHLNPGGVHFVRVMQMYERFVYYNDHPYIAQNVGALLNNIRISYFTRNRHVLNI